MFVLIYRTFEVLLDMSLLVVHTGVASCAGVAQIPDDCVLAVVVVGIPAGKTDK
jgi:hypothetical protein